MTEVFSDNIFAILCALVFQQTVGIPMDAKCSAYLWMQNMLLLDDLFLYCCLNFKQRLLKKNEKTLVPSLNITLHYADDVISLYNSIFSDFIYRIYPIELVIKDVSYTDGPASFLDLHIEIETLRQKRLVQFSHCERSI